MRKREQYARKKKSGSKIPTLIIMCVTLFTILVFGRTISDNVASLFEPAPDEATGAAAPPPSNAGTAISAAYRSAANSILRTLSKDLNR